MIHKLQIMIAKLLLTSLLFLSVPVFAADLIIGSETTYTVQKGDNLLLIGAKLGVFWRNIPKDNNLDPNKPLVAGAILKINTRKIVPKVMEDGIVINIPDRTLYLFKGGKLTAIPVGLGVLTENSIADWRTPTGKFTIVNKRKDPSWRVPESIQREMELQGKEVEEMVPPGPDNPLGRYALDTSIPGVLIHETTKPRSVYRYLSHGCIRVLPEHMEELYKIIDVKTKGEIIYEPLKIAVSQDEKIYLEARTDVYKRVKSLHNEAKKLIEARGVSNKVDWHKVERLVKEESGVAEDITLPTAVAKKASLTQRLLDFLKSPF